MRLKKTLNLVTLLGAERLERFRDRAAKSLTTTFSCLFPFPPIWHPLVAFALNRRRNRAKMSGGFEVLKAQVSLNDLLRVLESFKHSFAHRLSVILSKFYNSCLLFYILIIWFLKSS